MNKTISTLVFTFLLSLSANALQTLKISDGHYVAYEAYSGATEKTAPTLIFLPGINRGLDERDVFIKQMTRQKKFNFVSYHSSLHPESLRAIPENEEAYFQLTNVTSLDLANEAILLTKKLKIKNPIFVSLSYSSTISTELAHLLKTGFIIEAAPMIRFDESDPTGSQTLSFWKNWFNLFPGVGPIWSNELLKQAYTQYWSKEVDGIVENSPDYAPIRSLMVQGYAQLSIAADGFDYRKQDFAQSLKRYFILADQEDEERFALQNEAIAKYDSETQTTTEAFIISDSGHVIPSDAPQMYIDTLRKILKSEKLIN